MPENKTKPTAASVAEYIASRANEEQRRDCKRLMALCKRVTGATPVMWGPSIVGYGKYRYTTPAGRSGEMPLAAFAIRGRHLVVYLDCDDATQTELLRQLGPHEMGKSCLYLKRLADIDESVLERLVASSVERAART